MPFPRITAVISVFILIAVVALVSIGLMNTIGTQITHGNTAVSNQDGMSYPIEHSDGVITRLAQDNSFTLKNAMGQNVIYVCSKRCLSQIDHIQRHINERAHTDIYFIRNSNQMFEAVDVD